MIVSMSEESRTSKLTVAVEAEMLSRLHIVARRQGKTVSQIIREFVTWYVDKNEEEKR